MANVDEAIRFSFQCPDNGFEVAGEFDPETGDMSLWPNRDDLEYVAFAGPETVAEAENFCKRAMKSNPFQSWRDARAFLINRGVDGYDL